MGVYFKIPLEMVPFAELAPHQLCFPWQWLAGYHHLLQHQRWLGGGHADSHHHVYSRGRALLYRSVKGDADNSTFSVTLRWLNTTSLYWSCDRC